MNRRACLAILAFGIALCSACDFGSFSAPAVSATCAEIGAHCQLPDGPIGVCQRAPCSPGAEPPCFRCTSQH